MKRKMTLREAIDEHRIFNKAIGKQSKDPRMREQIAEAALFTAFYKGTLLGIDIGEMAVDGETYNNILVDDFRAMVGNLPQRTAEAIMRGNSESLRRLLESSF